MNLRKASEGMTVGEAILALRDRSQVRVTMATFVLERLGAYRLARQLRDGRLQVRILRAIRFLKAIQSETEIYRIQQEENARLDRFARHHRSR